MLTLRRPVHGVIYSRCIGRPATFEVNRPRASLSHGPLARASRNDLDAYRAGQQTVATEIDFGIPGPSRETMWLAVELTSMRLHRGASYCSSYRSNYTNTAYP
jgi:hypothetical protein